MGLGSETRQCLLLWHSSQFSTSDSDWEVSHYRATEELLVSKPSHGGGRVHTLEEVEQEQNVGGVLMMTCGCVSISFFRFPLLSRRYRR